MQALSFGFISSVLTLYSEVSVNAMEGHVETMNTKRLTWGMWHFYCTHSPKTFHSFLFSLYCLLKYHSSIMMYLNMMYLKLNNTQI